MLRLPERSFVVSDFNVETHGSSALRSPIPIALVPAGKGWIPRFFRQQAVHWLLLLGIGEFLLLVAAVFAAIYLRYITSPSPLGAYVSSWWLQLGRAGIFAVVLLLGLAALGLYQTHMRETWFGVLARQAVGVALGWIVLVVLYYLVPDARIGRGILILALLIALLAIVTFRTLMMKLIDVEALKRRVLVLGAGTRAALITHTMRRRADRRGFALMGFVARNGEAVAVPRVSDLDALASSTSGKIEIESMDDGRDEHVVEKLVKSAVLTVFKERCPIEQFRDVPAAFEGGQVVHAGDDVPAAAYAEVLQSVPALAAPVKELAGSEDPAAIASAIEFILEGLHLSKRLNKDAAGNRIAYRGR